MSKELHEMAIGLQLVGRAFDEATVLRTAYTFEANAEPLPRPPLP